MSTKTVTLWCTLHPAAGKEDECRQVLLDLAAKVHEVENTCSRYEVFEKSESKAGLSKVAFHLLEQWPAQADLDRHTERDWLVAIRKRFEDGLLAKDELIENVSKIGGFTRRS
ncbi:acid phosphatase [Colletotrichum orchidophilum]|uniref:Acid phosphatase n=1 Tax=Colletotrichum orchidophilum TaxID=1209926 RepID=A0A1G4B8X8_9PEZI|nr:acid phosphatase [Colletotrichum orchidophilum]OHE97877.1 acid phosphatase [Colletotrichum orchidophilum]